MAVGALEDQFYENLVRVLGLAPGDSERSDPAGWGTLRTRMAGIFRQRTQEEWTAAFSGAEACVTPVLSLHDAPRHPQSLERGTFDSRGRPRSGPVFTATPTGPAASPPERGQDSGSILCDWLGAARPRSGC